MEQHESLFQGEGLRPTEGLLRGTPRLGQIEPGSSRHWSPLVLEGVHSRVASTAGPFLPVVVYGLSNQSSDLDKAKCTYLDLH